MESKTSALPNRSFGWMMVLVLLVVGAIDWWRGHPLHALPLALALLLLVLTLWSPATLTPFTRAWLKLSEILHRVVSPITLGVLYFGMITPVAVAFKLARRDAMARRFEAAAQTYWVERDPPGPDIASLPRQF